MSAALKISEEPLLGTVIYGLVDPFDGHIKYIGKTKSESTLKERLRSHLKDKDHCPRVHWIQSLLKRGQRPSIEILDVVPDSEWDFWERWWISQFKAWGFVLKNYHPGGSGTPKGSIPWNKNRKRPYSGDSILRMSIVHKQRLADPSKRHYHKLTLELINEIPQKYDSGSTVKTLALDYSVSETRIREILSDSGRTIINKNNLADSKVLSIKEHFLSSQDTVAEIAKKFDVSVATVQRSLKRHDIIARSMRSRLVVSAETRKKRSESCKKSNNSGRRKIGEVSWNAIPILQLSKAGSLIREWRSANDATVSLKINNIFRALHNPARSAGGFKWSFKK